MPQFSPDTILFAARRSWLALLQPLTVNLCISAALRLVVPMTLEVGGERHLYYLMGLVAPLPGCPTYQCFRIVPPLVAHLMPFAGVNAFIVAGVVFEALAATMLWQIALRLDRSTHVAWLAACWFWVVWGPIPGFWDPLLIADPITTFWSLTALLLLLDGHYAIALPFLVMGAGVKEAVVTIPMVYAAYTVVARDEARKRGVWLAVLIAAPTLSWFVLRRFLIAHFGYVSGTDAAYLTHPYTFGLWFHSLGAWPRNVYIASLYVFSGFGAAWVFGLAGLRHLNRRQLALTVAGIPPMLFIASYMEPHRAFGAFPYVLVIPAAVQVARLPWPLVASLLVVNAAFTLRMSATATWLPRTPILLLLIFALIASSLWFARGRRDAGDQPPSSDAMGHRAASGRLVAAGAVLLMLLLGVPIARGFWTTGRTVQLALAPPGAGTIADDDAATPGLAVSPEGGRIAFVGGGAGGGRQLWIRSLSSSSADPVTGTEGATAPFWSPDGRAIGFFAGDALKTVDLERGRVRVLADAPAARGGTWGSRGIIVFASGAERSLHQVAAAGGPVTQAIAPPNGSAPGGAHRWPSFLPDGDHFLFVSRGAHDEGTIRVGSLLSGDTRWVADNATTVAYAPPGFLVSFSDGDLWASPFDTRRLLRLEMPLRLSGQVLAAPGVDRAAFAVSADTLAFATATAQSATASGHAQLHWVDRTGRVLGTIGDVDRFAGLSLAPDGRRFAARLESTQGVSLWDAARPGWSALSPDTLITTAPVWSPDGTRIAYAARLGDSGWRIYEQAISGTRPPRTISSPGIPVWVIDWAPDGSTLLSWSETPDGVTIRALPVDGATAATALFPGALRAEHARFSPDGRWIAYSAGDQRRDVYVEPYPSTGARWLISPDGGDQPQWRGDGRELVYVFDNRFFKTVSIATEPTFLAGVPKTLFEARLAPPDSASDQYAWSRDGGRFLISTIAEPEQSARVTVVLNWLRGAGIR